MTTTQRRIALLTGASLATLGLAAVPAYAAPPHSALPDGTYPGTLSVDPTIEICDLATPPGSPCFFGVIDTTGAASTANINSFVAGQIEQVATGTISIANNGTAEHGAIAAALNGAGSATATANAPAFIRQLGGGASPNLTIVNNGNWLFDVSAVASATGVTGSAFANAHLNAALNQTAVGTNVAIGLTNNATMTVVAAAHAVAASVATAHARMGTKTTGGSAPSHVVGQIGTGTDRQSRYLEQRNAKHQCDRSRERQQC